MTDRCLLKIIKPYFTWMFENIKRIHGICLNGLTRALTLSSLNLPLSSSSSTSRELLSQFPTCSGWRCFEVGGNYHVLVNQFHGNFHSKTLGCRKIRSVFKDVKWCFNAPWGLNCNLSQSILQNEIVKLYHPHTSPASTKCCANEVYCWTSIVDGGPTLNQRCSKVSCLLGRDSSFISYVFKVGRSGLFKSTWNPNGICTHDL